MNCEKGSRFNIVRMYVFILHCLIGFDVTYFEVDALFFLLNWEIHWSINMINIAELNILI